MAEGMGGSFGPGGDDDAGDRGIRPRTILSPVLAWLAAAFVLAVYLNQRGHWRSLEGAAAYRDCFGSPPAEGLRLVNAASFRRYRYTGEMLAMECYAQVEGEFDSSAAGWGGDGNGWRNAPRLDSKGGLVKLLAGHGLARAPEWFLRPAAPDSARVGEENQGKWFYVHAPGTPRLLIAGGWLAKDRRGG
jgi:hypothetical protein